MGKVLKNQELGRFLLSPNNKKTGSKRTGLVPRINL